MDPANLSIAISNLLAIAWAGFVGGRADFIACRSLVRIREAFSAKSSANMNHDIVQGVIRSFTSATKEFFQNVIAASIVDEELAFAKKVADLFSGPENDFLRSGDELTNSLSSGLSRFIGELESREFLKHDLTDALTDSVWRWLENAVGMTIPSSLKDAFCFGRINTTCNIPPWASIYRVWVAEQIKTNERLREIFFAQTLGELLNASDRQNECMEFIARSIAPSNWDEFLLNGTDDGLTIVGNPPTNLSHSRLRRPNVKLLTPNENYSVRFENKKLSHVVLMERFLSMWKVQPVRLMDDGSISNVVECETGVIELPIGSAYVGQSRGTHVIVLVLLENRNSNIEAVIDSKEEFLTPDQQKKMINILQTMNHEIRRTEFVVE